MIAVFTIIYVLCIWLVYVKLKIKPTPVNVAAAVTVGVVAVGLIAILWQFSAPTSNRAVVSRPVVQLVPQVRGPITKINAQPNVPLRKGKDVLFEIQRAPYQYKVAQLTASREAAKKTIEQLDARVKTTEAAIREAEASREAARAELESAKEADPLSSGAVTKLKVTQLTEKFAAANATVDKTKADKLQADAATLAARSELESVEAQLDGAKFDLAQCTVYAPADGFVTNWQVREGTMAVPLPLAPMGTFVDTSETYVVASFSQSKLKNVEVGDRAEFAFQSRPGEVFTGKVDSIIRASGEGQFTTTGQLQSAAAIGSSGKLAVKFELDDIEAAQSLAMGSAGMATIYTEAGKPFQIISTVTVRINAWLYYIMSL